MDFQTRPDVCKYMASLVPSECKWILEPTPGKGNLVYALLRKGFAVLAPSNLNDAIGRYDAICMNPPFSPMSRGYDILYHCMDMTDHIIALMPWLTIINSQTRTQKIIDWGLKSITHLPRSVFPGARVQCCILEMYRGYNWKIDLHFYPVQK